MLMKLLKNWFNIQQAYFKFSPFLALYILLVFLIEPHRTILRGDESRYLDNAVSLLNGYYSPPFPNINLWSGPGYSIVLMPLMYLKLSIFYIKVLHALLQYFSLVFTYQSIRYYSSNQIATIFCLLLGFYYPSLEMIFSVYTETLAWFLISLLCLLTIKTIKIKGKGWGSMVLTAFVIAYLAMTKIIFGYVIVGMLLITLIFTCFQSYRTKAFKFSLIFFFALLFCIPWLSYTYHLTHKTFYWGNSGNMSLYTMSSPYANELGDWKTMNTLRENPNHHKFIDSLVKLYPIQQDEAFKQQAILNIKHHPAKYVQNWIANIGRLLFSYPNTGKSQSISTFYTLLPNMFVLVFILIAFVIHIGYPQKVPFELFVLLLFMLVYLFGSSLVSAYRRQFFITLPFWGIYFAYFFGNLVSVKIKDIES